MKLTTITQASVDGVMQGPGAPVPGIAERGVFDRSGWAHFDNEAGTVMDEIFQRADAFLFGRLTYQMFAGSWGTWDDPGNSPIWTALHTKPKYLVSNTLTDPQWTNTTVLSSKIATAVRELKSKPGRSWTRSTSAPTRSCSAGGPTRSSPAPGERGTIRATARSGRR